MRLKPVQIILFLLAGVGLSLEGHANDLPSSGSALAVIDAHIQSIDSSVPDQAGQAPTRKSVTLAQTDTTLTFPELPPPNQAGTTATTPETAEGAESPVTTAPIPAEPTPSQNGATATAPVVGPSPAGGTLPNLVPALKTLDVVPPGAGTTPALMAQQAAEKNAPPQAAKLSLPPYQVLIALVFDVLSVLFHVW